VKICAVVPLNAPEQAKSRLAGVLTPGERAALMHWMAGRVLAALHAASAVAAVAVVSPSVELLDWAAAHHAEPLLQMAGDLNAGLELGRRWALARRADALLVLLGDLPYLRASEVAGLVAQSRAGRRAVVLAPDRRGRGTNGLLLRPADALAFAFGPASLLRHVQLTAAAGLDPMWYASYGTEHDLDTPADLHALRASGLWAPGTSADAGADGDDAGGACVCGSAHARAGAGER
jgi:2-phospho-L-lactate/phosphoenolpyruvate guanylyltransferase